jgi:histidinol-phosphatase (PHP family)
MIDLMSIDPIKQDMHMHTTFCDGKDSPEEMVLSAIEKGLERVGVSFHSVTRLNKGKYVSIEKEQAFRQTMQTLKEKYKDKIEVLCGIELDYYTIETLGGFDYIIGSVHQLNVNGNCYQLDTSKKTFIDLVNKAFNGDYYACAEEYYRCVADVVNKTNCDFIGHIDLITKFNKDQDLFDQNHPRYVKAWKDAVDKLVGFGIPFEINSGAISRGYQDIPYPMPPVLEYIKEKGGKLILSSDSHAKENVAFEYDKWKNLL